MDHRNANTPCTYRQNCKCPACSVPQKRGPKNNKWDAMRAKLDELPEHGCAVFPFTNATATHCTIVARHGARTRKNFRVHFHGKHFYVIRLPTDGS